MPLLPTQGMHQSFYVNVQNEKIVGQLAKEEAMCVHQMSLRN